MLIIPLGKDFIVLSAQRPVESGIFCVIVPQDPLEPLFYFGSCDLSAPSFTAAA
jgi:hypothetical protein